jgi:DNA-binding NarL/FixJ family response regulator
VELLGTKEPITDYWQTLTPREQQVAVYLIEGLTNHDIALRLGISAGTVHTYLTHLFQKVDVHSRKEIIRKLVLSCSQYRRVAWEPDVKAVHGK